jgi:hypothetical protein
MYYELFLLLWTCQPALNVERRYERVYMFTKLRRCIPFTLRLNGSQRHIGPALPPGPLLRSSAAGVEDETERRTTLLDPLDNVLADITAGL